MSDTPACPRGSDIPRGHYLDLRIMRIIQRDYPTSDKLLAAANMLVQDINDSTEQAYLKLMGEDMSTEDARKALLYGLCLLELAVTVISPRAPDDFDMDFQIRNGREYVGPRRQPKPRQRELLPYRRAIETLAAVLPTYE